MYRAVWWQAVRVPSALMSVLALAAGVGCWLLRRRKEALEVVSRRAEVALVETRLTVRDTGAGLNAAQRVPLFQPFNRLGCEGGSVPGTGIGLVTTRSLVERMNGRLTVSSEPGVGSEFCIELPLSAPAAATGADAMAEVPVAAALPQACGEVTYVDDDEINRLLMQGYLAARPGVRLRVATSGAESLALARARRPELMMIDLMMPA